MNNLISKLEGLIKRGRLSGKDTGALKSVLFILSAKTERESQFYLLEALDRDFNKEFFEWLDLSEAGRESSESIFECEREIDWVLDYGSFEGYKAALAKFFLLHKDVDKKRREVTLNGRHDTDAIPH